MLLHLVVFFFFKQKTAYEMRISDWSSDVCSSDLLTGPSLAGLWQGPAGKVEGFARYSAGLRSADFDWDATVLDAWLADPRAMIPDTRMVFRGIPAEQDRADLVAFLALAMAPGGAEAVVERDLVPADYARGQKPEPMTPTPPGAQVPRIRHCGDSYVEIARAHV